MSDIFPPLLGTLLCIAFFYFGYRDDYRRDKKGFIITIVSVFTWGIVFVFVSRIFAVILLPVFVAFYKKHSKGNKNYK
ncbi:MAG: hypothetical protein ACI85O_000797 [Saprospiraceae bacterium]|jgi:uncharacterized protein YqhQ